MQRYPFEPRFDFQLMRDRAADWLTKVRLCYLQDRHQQKMASYGACYRCGKDLRPQR